MRFLLILFATISLLFGATKEQVDKYFLISNSAQDIADIENSLQKLQDYTNPNNLYDTALVEIKFKERLQQILSESEMDEVIKNYDNLLYARVIRELNNNVPYEEIFNFKQENPYDEKRLEYIKEIVDNIYKKEFLLTLFDNTQAPIYKKYYGKKSFNLSKEKSDFVKMVYTNAIDTLYYNLQDLTMQDLESIANFTKRSSVYLEQKATLQAYIYATKELFKRVAK